MLLRILIFKYLPSKNQSFFAPFLDTNSIPKITTTVPNICNNVSFSFKKITTRIIVEIGPIPAITTKLEAFINLIEIDTKNEGITVVKTAIKSLFRIHYIKL